MQYSEVKDLAVKELKSRIQETRTSLFDAKMKNTLGQMNNPLKIRSLRRDLARLLTALGSKVRK